jgi:hypothetical protein
VIASHGIDRDDGSGVVHGADLPAGVGPLARVMQWSGSNKVQTKFGAGRPQPRSKRPSRGGRPTSRRPGPREHHSSRRRGRPGAAAAARCSAGTCSDRAWSDASWRGADLCGTAKSFCVGQPWDASGCGLSHFTSALRFSIALQHRASTSHCNIALQNQIGVVGAATSVRRNLRAARPTADRRVPRHSRRARRSGRRRTRHTGHGNSQRRPWTADRPRRHIRAAHRRGRPRLRAA